MGNAETRPNLINSIYLESLELEAHNQKLQDKYKIIEDNEIMVEEYMLDDAEYVGVSYGVVSRIMKSAVDKARAEGIKVGMLRPKTLFPFPKPQLVELAKTVKKFMVFEMSNGQMVDDVRLSIECKKPVDFYGRMGGVVHTVDEIYNQFKKMISEVK